MKAEKWAILGALAALAALAINKQLRIQRHRLAAGWDDDVEAGATERASIDDVPTVQAADAPASESLPESRAVEALDERIAPAAPF